jgi:hypothetical protein
MARGAVPVGGGQFVKDLYAIPRDAPQVQSARAEPLSVVWSTERLYAAFRVVPNLLP